MTDVRVYRAVSGVCELKPHDAATWGERFVRYPSTPSRKEARAFPCRLKAAVPGAQRLMAKARHCPSCGLPLGPLERHGRQRDCICALQAHVKEAGEALRILCGQDTLAQAEEELDKLVPERDEISPALAGGR